MSMAFENVDYTSLDIPAAPFSDPARIPDFPKNKVPPPYRCDYGR